jgi:MIP family channel proteins
VPSLLQRSAAEFVGTFFLVFIGVGAIATDVRYGSLGTVGIALAFGAVVAAMVYATGHLSGAHLNPAVTLGFTATGHFARRDAYGYVAAQLAGATVAAFVLDTTLGLGPAIGVTSPTVPLAGAFAMEGFITFALMFVIMAVATDGRVVPGFAGVAIGLAVAMGAMVGGPVTGGSMNPARSFGPSLATGQWPAHWLYWVAPCMGAVAGAVSYQLLRGGEAPRASSAP